MPNHRYPAALLFFALLAFASQAFASAPCIIFVHGLQKNEDTYTTYSAARNYWKRRDVDGNTLSDFIAEATGGPTVVERYGRKLDYYVIGYNGTQAWAHAYAAGEVTRELIRATTGQYDGGAYDDNAATPGRRCPVTGANGGRFIVVAHSMGAVVMDYILGNNDKSDPWFNNDGARFDLATQYLEKVISVGGPHRGSQGADAICGDPNQSFTCRTFGSKAHFFGAPKCNAAVRSVRTDHDARVAMYASRPARKVYLTSGYEDTAQAGCLNGEDDGSVQYASAFACVNPYSSYNNGNVCGESGKIQTNFHNLDGAREIHEMEVNDAARDERKAIPDGIWVDASGARIEPGTVVRTRMSTAQFVQLIF